MTELSPAAPSRMQLWNVKLPYTKPGYSGSTVLRRTPGKTTGRDAWGACSSPGLRHGSKEAFEMAPHPAANSNCMRDPEQELLEPSYPPQLWEWQEHDCFKPVNFGVIPYTAIQTTKINPHPNLKLNAESQGTGLERGAFNLLALGRIWGRS